MIDVEAQCLLDLGIAPYRDRGRCPQPIPSSHVRAEQLWKTLLHGLPEVLACCPEDLGRRLLSGAVNDNDLGQTDGLSFPEMNPEDAIPRAQRSSVHGNGDRRGKCDKKLLVIKSRGPNVFDASAM